jgi:hypothetical protein
MEIGKLSAKYESNGDPGAIGFDAGGGWSYGTNQIATKTGTFGYFLMFCKDHYPEISAALESAGGFKGATDGTAAFKLAWKGASKHFSDFGKCQHEYIVENMYGTTIKRLKAANIDLSSPPRTNTLADVIYSLSVMAGPGTVKANGSGCCGLIVDTKARLNVTDISTVTDAVLIDAIYNEKLQRIDSGREYKNQTDQIKHSVRNRVVNEHKDAVAMLAAEVQATPGS